MVDNRSDPHHGYAGPMPERGALQPLQQTQNSSVEALPHRTTAFSTDGRRSNRIWKIQLRDASRITDLWRGLSVAVSTHVLDRGVGDPSLRLKNGFVQDDSAGGAAKNKSSEVVLGPFVSASSSR